MGPGDHLWGMPWTTCWPGGPGAAAPPPLASEGATLLRPDLHRLLPHTAYKRRGGIVFETSDIIKKLSGNKTVQRVLRF